MFENQTQIKENNKMKIVKLLAKKRQLTKNDISKELKLSIPTVSSNIRELVDEKILFEAGQVDSLEGRKPTLIEYNPNYRYSVGVELKEDYIRMIITNLDSKIMEDYYKQISPSTPEEIVTLLISCMDSFFKASSVEYSKLTGIGFSVHGYVNDEDLSISIFFKSQLCKLSFKKIMEYFNLPIYLENNIACAALAEFTLGSSIEGKNSIYLYVNNGVGAGIVINNQVHRGHDRIAGAIGHMTINIEGKKCRCGNNGCWEAYIKKESLVTEYNLSSSKSIDSIKDFFAKLEASDSAAIAVFKNYMSHFETGLKSVILMYNPDTIVLGGFLVEHFSLVKKFLSNKLFSQSTGIIIKPINIKKTKLNDDASVLGASLFPLSHLLK
jgi:predicted NBD/HSP70 family sugar kinase